MPLTKSINGGKRSSVSAVNHDVPINFLDGVYVISTGLKEPITVTKESGSAKVIFQTNGSRINVSLSSSLALGETATAVFKATQNDGSFIGGPINLTGIEPTIITLNDLSLSRDFINEGDTPGRLLGSLIGKTSGSVLTLVDDAGGRFVLSGVNILTGLVPLDHEEGSTLSITVRETRNNAVNSPKETIIPISINNVFEQPYLNNLYLAADNITEDALAGTVVGAILGKTDGSTLTLIDDAGGVFAISGNNLVVGSTEPDFETSPSLSITFRETLADSPNSPRDTTVSVSITNIFEQPNLNSLTLSQSSVSNNSPITIYVVGTTSGSTLSGTVPSGFVLDGVNRTISGTPSTEGTFNFSLTETLADSANSPRTTTLSLTITPQQIPATVSTQSGIQNILNGTTSVVPGSVITVAPGIYDTRSLTFSAQPSNVRWEASDPLNKPIFTGWKISPNTFSSPGGHLQFGNIDFNMPLPALGPAGSTTGAIFWSPLPSTIHSIILGDGSSLDALTIEDFDVNGNMLPWHLGGRMTHNNPFVSLSGAKNVTIRRGTIRRTRSGVEINGINGLTIEEVHFTEQHADPVVLQNGSGHLDNVIIRNNHFSLPSGDTANHHSDGIQLQPIAGPYQIRNVDIYGNTISALVPVICAQLDPTHTQVFPSLQGVSASSGNLSVVLPTNPLNGTIWAYMRTDSSGNTCTVIPGGTNTLSSGASQALSQNNVVLFTYNSATGQWAVEVTGQTFGQLIASRWHAQEIRLSVGTTNFAIDLPPASAGQRQYLFRCNTAAGGTVTFTLNGSDTYSEGSLPVVTSAGQAPTFVSNGTNQWSPLPLGYRAWFVQRKSDFTLGANEVGLVTKLNASSGNVTATLPVNGTGNYHIGREDGSSNVCRVVASGGNTITYNGASVTEIPFVQGYGIDITGNGLGGWSVTEQTPTYTFLFGNSGNYDNFRFFGNIGLVYGDFYRPEVGFKQAVFNNTVLRLALDDQNGDGVIGRYENNGGSQQNVIQLSGADAYGERNFGTGYIALGGYAPYGGGAAVPGKIKNNVMLATANSNDIVSALAPYLNGTNRSYYRPLTREEVIATARAKASSSLDGGFIGATGTNDTNGFYNFTTGQINTSILPRPQVEGTSPLSGATVGLDQNFQVTFNTFIKAGTGNVTLWNATDNVSVETFDVSTGLGSSGGVISFAADSFTIDPAANLVNGKTYHLRIASTAIVGKSYNNTYPGVNDGTYSFVSNSGVATEYTTLTADRGAYLTRTGALNANSSIKKAVFAFEARLVPNANAIHSLFMVDRTQDFSVAIVQSTGELRVTYGASSWRVASAVPVSGTTRKRIIITVDTTQSTIGAGVKVYIDGVLATLTTTSWTQNTALSGTDNATVIRALSGTNSTFNGEVAFIYFNALADTDAIPDFSNSTIRSKFDPGQIGNNGEGVSGTAPLFYKTGDRAAWESTTNLGTISGFAKVGSFL